MSRKCKCKCGVELLPAYKCEDIITKKGYASVECLTTHTRDKKAEKEQKAIKKRNADLKKKVRAENPRAKALRLAQELARISRADDDGCCTCVTCGHVGKWNDGFDGGHFIAKGSCSFWMLDERNIWPQCKACNGNGMKFGGKEAVYTLWMIDKFGREFVDHMHEMSKTVVKRSKADYDDFIKEATKEIASHKKRVG